MASLAMAGSAIKDFANTLKCLRQYSDELQIQATSESLRLSAVSPTRSAYAAATFEPSFFGKYRITKAGDDGEEGAGRVQIEMALKPLTKIIPPKSGNIDSCDIIILDPEADAFERANEAGGSRKRRRDSPPDDEDEDLASPRHRVVVRLRLPSGIVKTFTLQYSSSAMLVPVVSRDACTSSWVCNPGLLKQWTDHFHGASRDGTIGGNAKGTEEISFWFKEPSKIKVKSIESREQGGEVVVPKNPDIFARGSRQMSTEMTISTAEFDEYAVPLPNLINPPASHTSSVPSRPPLRDPLYLQPLLTFPLKEFRALIELAQSFDSSPVDAAFSKGGDPLLASVRAECVTMEFVIATNADDPAGMRKADVELKPKIDRTPVNGAAGSSRAPTAAATGRGRMQPPPVPQGMRTSTPPRPRPRAQDKGKAPATENGLFRPADEDDDNAGLSFGNDEYGDDDLSYAALDRVEAEAIAASQARVIESSQRAERMAERQKGRVLQPESTQPSTTRRSISVAQGRGVGKGTRGGRLDDPDNSDTQDEDEDESQLKGTQKPAAKGAWEIDID